jgi:hypothetical protein
LISLLPDRLVSARLCVGDRGCPVAPQNTGPAGHLPTARPPAPRGHPCRDARGAIAAGAGGRPRRGRAAARPEGRHAVLGLEDRHPSASRTLSIAQDMLATAPFLQKPAWLATPLLSGLMKEDFFNLEDSRPHGAYLASTFFSKSATSVHNLRHASCSSAGSFFSASVSRTPARSVARCQCWS